MTEEKSLNFLEEIVGKDLSARRYTHAVDGNPALAFVAGYNIAKHR